MAVSAQMRSRHVSAYWIGHIDGHVLEYRNRMQNRFEWVGVITGDESLEGKRTLQACHGGADTDDRSSRTFAERD